MRLAGVAEKNSCFWIQPGVQVTHQILCFSCVFPVLCKVFIVRINWLGQVTIALYPPDPMLAGPRMDCPAKEIARDKQKADAG
jgi:hypothetical protein